MPTSRSSKPNVVITMGDPAGVGPEVALKSLASPKVRGLANFLLIGDLKKKITYGKCSPSYGRASVEYLDKALELLTAGKADALVTAPINKTSVRMAGLADFEGHTEYLAKKTRTRDYAMMFVGGRLKVALVTRHIALRDVPAALSGGAIYKTIVLAHRYLVKYFNIRNPKIAVAGLNPHAGENGAFGSEEKDIIIPAIKKASRTMKGISGPVPPDAVFSAAFKGAFDCVVALYHDQALGPFKMLYFDSGVNLTLGLPFVRTSPDHGTAFDIAGKGIASPASMIEAIRLACRLAMRQ